MSAPPRPLPDPRGYVDYRRFLADAISAGWGEVGDGARLDFAQAAGCTLGHLVNILNEDRHLQDELVDGFVEALNLRGEQRSAFLLLLRRARPINRTDAEDIEERLLALRQDWLAERDAAASRVVPDAIPPHPAVASHRQDHHSAAPSPGIAVGLAEAVAIIGAKGRMDREYRFGLWTVPAAAFDGLAALLDAGAAEMKAYFNECAATCSDKARRFVWQAQLALATEPVPEDGASATDLAPPTPGEAAEAEDGEVLEEPPPSVFDYLSHNAYLNAWVEARKAMVPGFTLGRLAVRAHASAGYLHQIGGGTRNPDGALATALSQQMGHTEADHLHYLRLIRLRVAESDAEFSETMWEIVEVLTARARRPAGTVAWALAALPPLSGLLQIVRAAEFREDPAWLGRMLNLAPRRVQGALRFLERAELVARDPQGRLRPVDVIWRGGGSDPDPVRAARLARLWVLHAQRAAPQNWRPHLLWRVDGPLSVPQFRELLTRAAALNTRLQTEFARLERTAGQAKDQVVQIQYQAFPQVPLSTRRRRKKKKTSGE